MKVTYAYENDKHIIASFKEKLSEFGEAIMPAIKELCIIKVTTAWSQ
jgi:hypothetical protein